MLAAQLTVDDVASVLKATNLLEPIGHYPRPGCSISSSPPPVEGAAGHRLDADRGEGGATVRVSDPAWCNGAARPDVPHCRPGRQRHRHQRLAAGGREHPHGPRGHRGALGQLQTALPAGLKLVKTYDLAEFVQSAIANVRDAILIGAGLAVLVLLGFLRNWRLTLVAACTLPLTVVCTFFFMRLFVESINLMSMGGLAIAIGLVIDDAVVVVENIHRRLAAGGGRETVEAATGELVAPIVGSTLTTVVVFAPLGLLSGVVRAFFKALSITLSVPGLISMLLALFLLPLLAEATYRRRRGQRTTTVAGCSTVLRRHSRLS